MGRGVVVRPWKRVTCTLPIDSRGALQSQRTSGSASRRVLDKLMRETRVI